MDEGSECGMRLRTVSIDKLIESALVEPSSPYTLALSDFGSTFGFGVTHAPPNLLPIGVTFIFQGADSCPEIVVHSGGQTVTHKRHVWFAEKNGVKSGFVISHTAVD